MFSTDSRFRWDYFEKYHEKTGRELTGFQKFMDAGVRSEYLESVFPAESFPAWQTIQTGVSFGKKKLGKRFVHFVNMWNVQASTQKATELLATNFMTERSASLQISSKISLMCHYPHLQVILIIIIHTFILIIWTCKYPPHHYPHLQVILVIFIWTSKASLSSPPTI